MRRKFLRSAAALLGATAVGTLTACGGGSTSDTSSTDLSTALARAPGGSSLSAEEIAAMRYMREEEKLAHDVYVTIFGLWPVGVFDNIAASETQHTEAILGLLTKYGLDDPAAGKAVGEFEDPKLQALYDQLIAMGRAGEIEALRVGALIEETDIRDINAKLAITDNADIVQVYGNLLCGSTNHLRAFNEQLLARGVRYVPQVITQQEWDAIASAEAAVCGG